MRPLRQRPGRRFQQPLWRGQGGSSELLANLKAHSRGKFALR
jgi:hypothetical protein